MSTLRHGEPPDSLLHARLLVSQPRPCPIQQYETPPNPNLFSKPELKQVSHSLSLVNSHDARSGKDVNAILASIHLFDPSAGCDDTTFQPCSHRALSTHKILADAFRHEYPINHGIGPGKPVAIGRYPEDVYFGGHPWYLATLAAAEQMYDALYVWQQDGRVDVTETSLPFFRDFSATLGTGTYLNNSAEFGMIMNAVARYADGFLQIVADHVHPNGSIAEQFTRDEGTPTSARDLTWSYGALLSAIARRDKQTPREWLPIRTEIPQTCAPISIIGYYASANPSPFPPLAQALETNLPKANLVPEGSCPPTRYVVVRFDVRARTSWGQKIRMVGDQDILGSWDPRRGVDLDASTYTEKDPVWSVSMVLLAGHTLKYKFVRVSTNGDQIEWENDPDRTYSAPTKCNTADVVSEAWQ